MPANEVISYYESAYTQKLTCQADVALTGKTFAGPLTQRQSGPGLAADPLAAGDGGVYRCAGPPTAAGAVSGVVMWDVVSGSKFGLLRGADTVVPVTSGAAISVGQELQVDGSGRVVPYSAGRKVGLAHSAAAGAGVDVEVELYPIGL